MKIKIRIICVLNFHTIEIFAACLMQACSWSELALILVMSVFCDKEIQYRLFIKNLVDFAYKGVFDMKNVPLDVFLSVISDGIFYGAIYLFFFTYVIYF